MPAAPFGRGRLRRLLGLDRTAPAPRATRPGQPLHPLTIPNLDGFLARATGQYSRLGALMDPIVDRITILAGAVVCWHFELLPRWALAVLVARELLTLVLAQAGLRRGLELEVNWLGRAAVWPVMAAIFFAMVTGGWFPTSILLLGLVTALLATVMYARMGLRDLR